MNRKGVAFLHDNARPHASITTRKKLLVLGWDVLVHPPYSSDLALSDFHLFRCLQNVLMDKKFSELNECNIFLDKFFARNDSEFYTTEIFKLPQRWQKVIDQSGK